MNNWPSRREVRKAEKRAVFEAEQEARSIEEARKAKLTMWERIEECDASPSVKDILHRLIEGEA